MKRVASSHRIAAAALTLVLAGGMVASASAATVPDLIGLTYDVAYESLEDARLSPLTYREDGSSVAVFIDTNWKVVDQDPAAGQELDDGSSVAVNLTKLSDQEADVARDAKKQRMAEKDAAASEEATVQDGEMTTGEQAQTRSVVVTGTLPADGVYNATVATDSGEMPITVTIEDGMVAMIAFAPQDVAAAEDQGDATEPSPTEQPATEAPDAYIDEVATEQDAVAPKVPIGMQNAVRQAESYLSFMSFSRNGLIEQLEYEGFSEEEATYGADNSGADWNEQAALKAQSYLDFMAFSRDGLVDQLEYEGFTYEQAEYGVTAVGY